MDKSDIAELQELWETQALHRYEHLSKLVQEGEKDSEIAAAAVKFIMATEKLAELKK